VSCFTCVSSGQKHRSVQPELAGPLGSNQLGIKPSPQKASNPKAASASSSLNRSSSGKTVPSIPGSGISRAGSGAVSSTAMTGSGVRKSSSGAANISDDPANSGSGIASISGGGAAASNGSRGGMAVETDGSGGSNGSRGGMAVQTDGSSGSRGGMALQTGGGSGSNAGISSTDRQGSAQANVTVLPVDTSKFPFEVWPVFQSLLSAMTANQDAPGCCYSTQGFSKASLPPQIQCSLRNSFVDLLTCCLGQVTCVGQVKMCGIP